MRYAMVLYDFDSNLIWATTIPSKTRLRLVTTYKYLCILMQQQGLHPQLKLLDNEYYNLLKYFMTANHVEYKLTPEGKTLL